LAPRSRERRPRWSPDDIIYTGLECGLVSEEQIGDSVVEDEGPVGRVDDTRQIHAHHQHVSCSSITTNTQFQHHATRDRTVDTSTETKFSRPILRPRWSLKFWPVDRDSPIYLSIWLLTTPPHLKYVATLPYNLSSMACFADINVLLGSVATCARCGGIFKNPFNCKFTKESSSEKNFNRLRIDRIMVVSLWPRFLAHSV